MSLIHEALKKLEGIKEDATRPPDYASPKRADGQSPVSRKSVLATVAVLTGVAVGLYSYFHYHSKPAVRFKVPLNAVTPARQVTRAQPPKAQETQTGNKKGIALYTAGQIMESAEEFKSAIESLSATATPEDKGALYNNLGVSYLAADDLTKAGAALRKSISLRPEYPEAVNNYGALLEKKGDHAGALKELRKAAALDPAYPDAHLNIAVVLETEGKYRDAAGEYGVFIRLASSRPYSQSSDYTDRAEEARNKVRKLNANLLITR